MRLKLVFFELIDRGEPFLALLAGNTLAIVQHHGISIPTITVGTHDIIHCDDHRPTTSVTQLGIEITIRKFVLVHD